MEEGREGVRESNLLVIIKYSVHILDPNSVNRTIEYQPLTVRRL